MNDYKKVELVWPGKRTDVERVPLPFQTVETINESKTDREKNLLFRQRGDDPGGWRNKLIWGDNKYVMASLLEEYAGKINLIYIDPPFATGADFSFKVEIGGEEVTKDASVIEELAFRDTWGKGLESYLQMMYDRLALMRELLADNGSIYVHLDWHVGHYVKIIMDEIFGKENFRNELYCKRVRKNVQEYEAAKRLNVALDKILFYAKSGSHRIKQPRSEMIKHERWHAFDAPDIRSGMDYELFGTKPPLGRHWMWDKEKAEKAIKAGLLRLNEKTKKPEYKVISERAIISTLWDDLPGYGFTHGFDTEKSEKLLLRVIETSSKENDLVADFFCGSGTTLAVAEKLGRRWVGCDLSKFAIHTTRKRLLGIEGCKAFEVLNLGLYEKHKLAANGFGLGPAYVKFILDLYRADALPGFTHVHGRKAGRLVHVGAVDSVITEREIRLAAAEAKEASARALDVLGWDFEMGLHDLVDAVGDEYGVKIKLVQIPREALEVKDAREEVKFFDLNYLDVVATTSGKKVTVTLKDFAIANPEYLPEDVRKAVRKFTDFIDYWAVDFDYKGDTFHNMDQSYRTRKDRTLATKLSYTYEKPGKYDVLVRVVDIFGNDTTKLIKVKVA